MSNANLLIAGIAVIANLILGSVVYLENQKSITAKLFFLFTVSDALWSIFNYLSYNFSDPAVSLWLVRSVMFFAVPFANLFFFLMYVFPEEKAKYARWMDVMVATAALAMILSLSPYTFSGIILSPGSAPQPVISWGIIVFFLGAIVPIVLGLFTLVKKNLSARSENPKPLRFLLAGVLIMFACIIVFNFIFPISLNDTRFISFGALFTFPFVIFTTYAILRHHLLNIRLVASEGLIAFILIIMSLDIVTARTIYEIVTRVFILVLLLILGIYFIKSVLNEVRQREQLEKLSKELELANAQLKQLDEAKNEFLSVASHQLRTPLTAIKGYVSMFMEGDFGQLSPVQRENLQIIYDSTQRLTALIADLLDLSRIESGRLEFDFVAVDLCQVVESVVTELKPKAEAKGIYLFFDNINRSCPEIRADAEKIRQVVINLIDNAIKYTPQGGVTARLMKVGERLRLSVSDTGIGVPESDKAKLFEKFFRTEAATKVTQEGTGLGIYVVKKLVEAHGGKIWFESAGLGKGTAFIVELPIPSGQIKEEKIKIASMDAF